MAVIFVAESNNPYRENLAQLSQALGYTQFYPAIEHSQIKDYLPHFDAKTPIVFIEATGEAVELVPRRDAQLGVDRPVYVLRDKGAVSHFPSNDVLRLAFSMMSMKEAIAFARTNKTVNQALDWKNWHAKVSNYLERKIPFEEFKESAPTPLEAALRANINFGPIRDIIDEVKEYTREYDSEPPTERIEHFLEGWAEKTISPYLEISAVTPYLKDVAPEADEGVQLKISIPLNLTRAIIRGISDIEEIKDIVTLALKAEKYGSIFKLVLENPHLQKWADALIWNGLDKMLPPLIRDISKLDPRDPSSKELLRWTVQTLLGEERRFLLEKFADIVDKLDLPPVSLKLFNEEISKPESSSSGEDFSPIPRVEESSADAPY